MKKDNVVAFRSSAISGQGNKLKLQNDGNLVIYSMMGKHCGMQEHMQTVQQVLKFK